MIQNDTPVLPPADTNDPVVDAYLSGIDMSLINENLKLTPAQRTRKAERFVRWLDSIRGLAHVTTEDQLE